MLNSLSGFVAIILTTLFSYVSPPQKTIFRTNNGKITLLSVAPLETIKAGSDELRGIVDTASNTFAFSVAISSFKGFNSPLQQQHFYENYMESSEFPSATFSGKIIEIINYSKAGTYEVRAKGILKIHGVKQERIIKSTVEIVKNEIHIKSSFTIPLEEHNIKIPRIVFQKIAPDIQVTINAVLLPNQI